MNNSEERLLTRKSQQTNQLILNYVSQTSFFTYLRNSYHYFKEFCKPDLKYLVRTGEIFRVKDNMTTITLNFNQPTICIVIVGDVTISKKKYTKGQFFANSDEHCDMIFQKKATLVMLHKEDVESKLFELENFYFKKKTIQKILPLDLLYLTKKQIQNLINSCVYKYISQSGVAVNTDTNERGLYLLYEGNYSVTNKSLVKIEEITYDYFGEEILWQDQYVNILLSETNESRFMFIPKPRLLDSFSQENIKILKGIFNKKQAIRQQLEKNISQNIEYTRQFMTKRQQNSKKNSEYFQLLGRTSKKASIHEWKLKNMRCGNSKVIDYSKLLSKSRMSREVMELVERQKLKTVEDEDRSIANGSFPETNVFKATLYKDQRAKSERYFRRRIKTDPDLRDNQNRQIKQPVISDRQLKNLNNLPKTLSVLLKYYESTERIRKASRSADKTLLVLNKSGFVSTSKERRTMTTMKLHKQIFMRQYFEIKSLEDRAFKTWR